MTMRSLWTEKRNGMETSLLCIGGILAAICMAAAPAAAEESRRDVLVLTSTNGTTNDVVVFRLSGAGTPALSLVNMVPTGGAGGASGNAGVLQFADENGAVANYGSNTVSQLKRNGDLIKVGETIRLATGCLSPVSVALTRNQLFVAGANCAESHQWPSGNLSGAAVKLPDATAAQIAAGQSWAAVTLKSGSVLQLPLTTGGALNGTGTSVTLPGTANNTPFGAAFWGDLLGFNPAHSADSLALVNNQRIVFPIPGPQPPFPANAPCWVAKGPGNLWYTGNSPGHAVSIFFSDGQGGAFDKSVPLPGAPTDLTVSPDKKWLAVIYTATDGTGGHVAVFSIDAYGDLSLFATSGAIGVTSFNGVAISE